MTTSAFIWKKLHVPLIVLMTVLLVIGFVYQRTYPYGWSHCCDRILMIALENYADDHGGAFPAGENTPEASLSLLYPKYADANLLRGKTVPLATVQSILDRGERLGPESCGWHYVEGLSKNADWRLALVWDKVGLGHNGQRLDGGHMVVFVHFRFEHIPASQWDDFLQEQEAIHAERRKWQERQWLGVFP